MDYGIEIDKRRKKMNGIEFEVTGRKGLFTCPEFKVGGEKCTLQIPTYEALKGITKSIYWKPTITCSAYHESDTNGVYGHNPA